MISSGRTPLRMPCCSTAGHLAGGEACVMLETSSTGVADSAAEFTLTMNPAKGPSKARPPSRVLGQGVLYENVLEGALWAAWTATCRPKTEPPKLLRAVQLEGVWVAPFWACMLLSMQHQLVAGDGREILQWKAPGTKPPNSSKFARLVPGLPCHVLQLLAPPCPPFVGDVATGSILPYTFSTMGPSM